ncbi:MAG TPA: DUF3800 domain-containing protein [Firmicutes bacterium]|nr:DUF3800 domain-containing protein [Bacillota bacterium]
MKRDLLGAPNVELKGRDFVTRHVFDKRPNKKELLEQVFTLIQNLDIGVFSIIMDRPDFQPKKTPGRLENQYRFLVERINAYAEVKYPDEIAIVLLDSQDVQKDRERARAYSGFLYGHPLGQSLNKVLETPLFVDSETTPGIQLADLAASVIRQYHENLFDKPQNMKKDFYLRAINRYFNILKSKTMDFDRPDGTSLWGFYRMSAQNLGVPDSEHLVPDQTVA